MNIKGIEYQYYRKKRALFAIKRDECVKTLKRI